MLAKWLSNLRWALLLAIVAGPGFAYFTWTELETIKRVSASGVETVAMVDGGESRSGRRSGTTYKIHAIWMDASNRQHAENIAISSEYAHKIIENDLITVDAVNVKYLADDPKAPVFVSEDLPQQVQGKELMIWLGAGAGVIGLIGSAVFFLMGRRKAG